MLDHPSTPPGPPRAPPPVRPPTPTHISQTNHQSIKPRIDEFFDGAEAGTTLWFYLDVDSLGVGGASGSENKSEMKASGSGGWGGVLRCFLADTDLTEIELTAKSSMLFGKNVDGTMHASSLAEVRLTRLYFPRSI